jgi:hypothetical protein
MTTHTIIRNGLRTLTASLIAACLSAVLPLSTQAGEVRHQDLHITKYIDKSSPVFFKSDVTRGGTVHAGWNLAQNKKAARVTDSGGTKGPVRNTVTTGAKVH